MLHGGGFTARVRPWPSDPTIGHLVLLDTRGCPPSAVLRAWLAQVGRLGYRTVRTGAVHDEQIGPYRAVGFEVVQSLVLLSHPVVDRRPRWLARSGSVRSARTSEIPSLASLDSSAFPSGWGLDVAAITDAANATPKHRIAVRPDASGALVGYAVTGRSGPTGFLQRLAVAPDAQGAGIGRALVEDAIAWSRRWRVDTLAVNTQHDNVRALTLYESCGFQRRSNGLQVLERTLDGDW